MSESVAQLCWAVFLTFGLAFCWVSRRYQLLPHWFRHSPVLLWSPPLVGVVTGLSLAIEVYFSINVHRFFSAGIALVLTGVLLFSTPSRWQKAKFEYQIWRRRQE